MPILLSKLPRDIVRIVTPFLDATDIGRLWLSGDKDLRSRLGVLGGVQVLKFNRPSWPKLKYPAMLSVCYPHLEEFEIWLPIESVKSIVHLLRGLDVTTLPKQLKRLKIAFSNAYWTTAFNPQRNPNLSVFFPDLEELYIQALIWDPPVNLVAFIEGLPKNLRTFRFDLEKSIPTVLFSSLPRSLTCLAMNINLSTSRTPITVDLWPPNLTDLEIFSFSPASQISTLVHALPGSLLSLSFAADMDHILSHKQLIQFDPAKLPRTLKKFAGFCAKIQPSFLTEFPPSLEHFKLSTVYPIYSTSDLKHLPWHSLVSVDISLVETDDCPVSTLSGTSAELLALLPRSLTAFNVTNVEEHAGILLTQDNVDKLPQALQTAPRLKWRLPESSVVDSSPLLLPSFPRTLQELSFVDIPAQFVRLPPKWFPPALTSLSLALGPNSPIASLFSNNGFLSSLVTLSKLKVTHVSSLPSNFHLPPFLEELSMSAIPDRDLGKAQRARLVIDQDMKWPKFLKNLRFEHFEINIDFLLYFKADTLEHLRLKGLLIGTLQNLHLSKLPPRLVTLELQTNGVKSSSPPLAEQLTLDVYSILPKTLQTLILPQIGPNKRRLSNRTATAAQNNIFEDFPPLLNRQSLLHTHSITMQYRDYQLNLLTQDFPQIRPYDYVETESDSDESSSASYSSDDSSSYD